MRYLVKTVLNEAHTIITPYSSSPLLDAELLLAHVLKVKRSYLYTYPEKEMSELENSAFKEMIKRRQQGEPIAYILGEKEFWSLPFYVTPATLIPRPETELLVELVLQKLPQNAVLSVADLGTGSGAIALSLAYERPIWQLYATDKSADALKIARKNAARLKLNNVTFLQGEWCSALPMQKFSAIISNPPYIAEDDPHLLQGDLRFEPLSALKSGDNGLQDIQLILQQGRNYLTPHGIIFLEHGYEQAEAVRQLMQKFNYAAIDTYRDLQGHERVTLAQVQV